MSRHRTADDLFDFKRMFTLLLGLVVFPTLMLSGFGILAIKNERAALEKQQEDTYTEQAGRIEATLHDHLDTTPSSIDTLNMLLKDVTHKLYPEERAQFILLPNMPRADDEPTLAEILRGFSPSWPTSSTDDLDVTPVPVFRYSMQPPLQDYQLGVYVTGSNPVKKKFLRNTILYSSLMLLFLAAVIVGVVITARFIHREVRLSRLQTDFVSNISHELRTPLTSIRMFIETLQLGRVQDKKEVEECLSIVAMEAERLTHMIERILGWARMEAGRHGYHFQETSAQELISTALTAFRTQKIQAPFELKEEIEPDLPPLRADLVAISDALLNLLNNALKYTGEHKELGIRAYRHKGMVALEVSDNGIGIASADKKRVFEKFYRADALLSRKTEGSGLGLTIVRHIVDAHSGRIQVESELGTGSRFTILLPTAATTSRMLKG